MYSVDYYLSPDEEVVDQRWGVVHSIQQDEPLMEFPIVLAEEFSIRSNIRSVFGHNISYPLIREMETNMVHSNNEPKEVKLKGLDWVFSNLDTIEMQNKDQWIAVKEDKIVASASTPKELRELLVAGDIKGALVTKANKDGWSK